MNFDLSEKLAIVNVIDAVIVADGKIHKGEINALSRLMSIIDFDSNFLIQARTIDTAQSVVILKKMSQDKKNNLAQILEDVALADGFIHEKENDLINYIYNAIGMMKAKRG
ncbi:TerB family tellurite resistance protein [Maribacter sp. MAR_2009_72]|uniref:tellurite resistance TerB family protein n=1 Tax=Maribacter sp. MAR_2009_72 TaxID=1250050 RepID=UPI00119913C7|nr:TerB family tellurite resistance protein [Maribacter sp. MAR_2009_72]TVZ16479.1 putative tellurite resistance protein B-like protein [Maribacter sp. MAR_2009_72]